MSSDVILFCEQLKSTVGSQDTKKASTYLNMIDQLFNDRLSENEIDLAIETVCKEDGGVLGFLKLCLNQPKIFKNENNKSFDLLCKIIELHPIKMTRYATNTVIICTQYMRSMQTSAKEREKAATVIEQLVVKNCCDEVDRRYLMSELLKIVQMLQPGIALSRTFELIGRFAKDYPDCIENEDGDGVKIRDMYFKALEKAVINQQDTSIVSLTGALNGLNDFLENFTPSHEYKDDFAKRIYKCVKPLAKPVESPQKTMNRSALKLLATRCELFGKHIFDDFYFWHDLLTNTWLQMDQFENRRAAIYLLHAVHREVAVHLLQDDDTERCLKILTFLQEYLKTILESSNSQPFEIRLAIVGFGLIAAPCRKLFTGHLDELLNLVMQRTKSVANAINHNDKNQLEHFPDYVEALSRIMEQVHQLSGVQLNILQDIIVSVIRNFHLLSTAIHEATINTLKRTFRNLLDLGDSILNDILEKVIYQGVIWTCSHKLPFDASNDWDIDTDWKDQLTYNSYLPLWNGFLSDSRSDRNVIKEKIYDQMMITLFKILNKLNLSVRKRIYRDDGGNDEELFFSDPNYDLEPCRVKDFHIFFNLVGFYRALLKSQSLNSHQMYFLKWIDQFIEEIISKSMIYPLVSGFIGLMQMILGITNRFNYFENVLFENNAKSYDNICYYLSKTIQTAQQSSGELQIASLKLLFTAPTCMVRTLIGDMIPIFQIAFKMGKSNTSLFLAEMALNTIEKYMETVNGIPNETKSFLQAVLPYFDTYLQGFKNDTIQEVVTASHRVHGAKRTAQKLMKIKESDLLKFQKRILFFLGTLEPEYCTYLIQNSEHTNLVKWSATQTIRLTLYGLNLNPKICLDALIPRICEIATSTSDRQKKLTACEIIHATILFLIGSYNHRGRLWSELCPLMIELACDKDLGVQQMFEPLVMQTMHYMSKNDQLHHAGTEILLKCLMDAISHPNNLAVRDLASRSLREFLSWSIRQVRQEQLAASPFNIVTLIQQLKMFSSDSIHQRRFGAALAFNNIYRVLREEECIVNKYWIDLLHDFCINFNLSEQQMEEDLNCQMDLKHVSSSLDHILRVLRERKDIFNKSDPDRIKPTPFENASLRDAVLWLFSHCNSDLNLFRQKMMNMFLALAPCVDGYNSSAALIRDTHSTESLINLCEIGIDFDRIETANFEIIYKWLRRINASLDCYIWYIENSFILAWKSFFEKCQIFKALQYYISNAMNQNICPQNENDIGGPKSIVHVEKINAEKCVMLVKLLNFLNKTMAIDCVPNEIWNQCELIWVIETAVFRPQFLESDKKNLTFFKKLPQNLESFITHVNRFNTHTFRTELNNKLINTTIDIYESLANSIGDILSRNSISTSDVSNLSGMNLICNLIRAKHIPLNENLKASIDVLASKVLYNVFDGIKEKQAGNFIARSPSPDILKFISNLLEVCFHKNNIYVNVIDLLLNSTELKLYDAPKPIKYGKHFFSLFKTAILQYFVTNLDIIVERLIPKMLPPNVSYVLRILIEITEEAQKCGSKNINQMKSLTNILLGKWPDMLAKSKADPNQVITTMTLIELVGQIAMICPYPLTDISKKAHGFEQWLLDIIKLDTFDFEIKVQALFLMPCLIGSSDYKHDMVQKTLESFQQQYFPLCTKELRSGTVQRSTYENAFQVILDSMLASKSPLLLEFILNCSASDPNHIMEFKIIESLRKFMTTLDTEHQISCLNTVFEMLANNRYDPALRMVILKRFLSNMVLSSMKEAAVQFYAAHIVQIDQLVETPYGLDMPEFRLEQAFTSRIIGFELLENMITIFSRDEICDKQCPILVAKFGNKIKKGNELLSWMTVKLVSTKSESFQTDNIKYMEWFRKYQCAAFKTVCATIANTQDQLKFYESWIFHDKNWFSMINTRDSNLYTNQTLEVDKKPQIKERMISIRQIKTATNEATPNRRYIESQTVFESSLSQDVTKIDLSSSYVRTTVEVEERQNLANYQPKVLMLEKNSVNDHEAMATICGVIEHMFENNITPINDDGTIRHRKLSWIENLCSCVANKSGNIHINIRIFLTTVIDNCGKWFKNYADVITSAILKFLNDWLHTKDYIDALTIFLCVDLLDWDSVYRIATPDEHQLCSDLVVKLMERAYSQQKEVFRRNLEIIRNLIESWRDFIRLPYRLLCDEISDPNIESKSNICGIHINGIVLTNGLVPWNEDTKQQYLQAISSCLINNHSDVYQPAAQVMGMVLHELIVKQNNGDIGEYGSLLNGIISRLKGWKQSNEKKFMYTIFYIDKHYVLNEFLSTILSLISSSASDVKKIYLQMLLARVNEAEARDLEPVLNGLFSQSQEHQHQLIGLHIFNKVISKFSLNQIKKLLPRIAALKDAKHTEIRDLVYEIMKQMREKYSSEDALNSEAKEILLNALNDVDSDLQNSVFKYWSQSPELPLALNERVLYMLRDLYSSNFLKYSVPLIIDLRSPDLKQKILQTRAGDDDTKYTEYDINVHWKTQDNSLRVPLFTESQQKQTINSGFDPVHSYLRATPQSMLFDPTLDPSTVYTSSNSFSLQSQNSLQFDVSPQKLNRRSQLIQPNENVQSNSNQTKFNYLRQRILRKSNEVSREMALSAVRRRNFRKMHETQQHQRKAGHITLFRRYRFGDYPDFFINSLAFLLPLQMLVKLDIILARSTFVIIMNAIYAELEGEQKRSFRSELLVILENIVNQPNNCNSLLFSAFTEIALSNDISIKIDAGFSNIIPNGNDMMINAILLYENRLNENNDAIESHEITWAELAELYYNLSEYDVAASIFSNKMNSDDLSVAIQYESNGDFRNALKTYHELVSKTTDAVTTNLYDKHVNDYCYKFSFNSIFNCFEVMGRWEDLERNVIDQLTSDSNSQSINYEQLWTDEWNVKHLLPHYIRSELRTLVYGQTTDTIRTFLVNIDQWLRNTERADYIKRHFGEQLMILHIANNDYRQSKAFSQQYFEHFLDEWSTMTILSEKMRNNELMNARRVAEIHKYSDLLLSQIDDIIIAHLCNRWGKTQINSSDSTQMWEALIAYRIFVTERALDKFNEKYDPIVKRLIENMFDMQFKLNEVALQQQNIELSISVLGRLNTFRRSYGANTVRSVLQYELAAIRLNQMKFVRASTNPNSNAAIDKWTQIFGELQQFQANNNGVLQANPDIQIKVFDQLNEIAHHLQEIQTASPSSIDTLMKHTIFELIGCANESQGISEAIGVFALERCYQTIELIHKCEQNQSQIFASSISMKENAIGESYYRLAIFCFKHSTSGLITNKFETNKLLIKTILRGMRYESKNARLQFPRLLQLSNINANELCDIFNEELHHVPLWTFLGSISQIMSRFDFEKICFLDNLVLRLATGFPSIIVYSFQLSHGIFCKQNPDASTRPLVQQILNTIEDPLVGRFIESLKCLTLPEIVIKHCLYNIMSEIENSHERYQQQLQLCYENVFENPMRGKITGKSEQLKKEFIGLMEKCRNIDDKTIKDMTNQFLAKNFKSIKSKADEKLAMFCPWLAQYHWYGCDKFIELPGQYTGSLPPNASTSLKIVKFNPSVSILHSLRKPIKFSMICSNGKSYSFLLKYGEDLRQDDRIQHVQELMSQQMQLDRNCSQQKLCLRTYKVLPLNMDCGLIRWIKGTESIQSFLLANDRNWNSSNTVARVCFDEFISKSVNIEKSVPPNVKAVLHYKPEQIGQNLQNSQRKVPKNSLRNSLYKLSATPECFYALRNNYGKSLAAMSIAHWILGIGDRNLGNFLIDKNNGQLIGIDFNMAFGMATRKLSIPELVPFRLTAQFVNVLKPLETSCFLVKNMTHILRTFRIENESLMAALEMFVNDPTIDNDNLFNCSSTSNTTSNTSQSSSDAKTWQSKQHLKMIRSKLSGTNPVQLIENDIEICYYFNVPEIVLAYTTLINGSSNTYRYKLKEQKQKLTAEEQVKCLIEIATDPSVLGACYTGFHPWV